MEAQKETQFVENLVMLMKAHNLSLHALAREISLLASTLSEWVLGRKPRDLANLKKLADRFGLTVDQIYFQKLKMNMSFTIVDVSTDQDGIL